MSRNVLRSTFIETKPKIISYYQETYIKDREALDIYTKLNSSM